MTPSPSLPTGPVPLRGPHFLLIVGFGTFATALAIRSLDPMITALARDFGETTTRVALLASAFALPYALGQPFLGPIGDAWGKVRVMVVCLAIMSAGFIASALVTDIDQLFVLRIVTGLAGGGVIPVVLALIGDNYAFAERQVALSRFLMAVIIGQLAGAVGSGLIVEAFGWRMVFALGAVATTLALVMTVVGLRPGLSEPMRPLSPGLAIARYRALFADPRARTCFGAVVIEGMAIFGILPFIVVLLELSGAGGPREAGFVVAGLATGGIVYTLGVRRLLATLGMGGLMRIGGLLAALGLVAASLVHGWVAETVAFMAVGLGFYMLHSSLQTQVTELSPQARASAVAVHAFFFFVGQSLGPVVIGPMLAAFGPVPTLGACALSVAAAGLIAAHRLTGPIRDRVSRS
jgi:MFS family permease